MTLSEYERRLKLCNPKLRIKRIASGKGGIHCGNTFVCRIDSGELTQYNQWKKQYGWADDRKTALNPEGAYTYRLTIKRGRVEAARILYNQGFINQQQLSILS